MLVNLDVFKKPLLILLVVLALLSLTSCLNKVILSKEKPVVFLYTTTSVYETGLLDYLLKDYLKAKVKVIAVGTGEALKNAELGNADVLLVHAPFLEKEYLKKGVLQERKEIAFNYFLLIGPANDPAGISSASTIEEALTVIFRKKAPFASRGDHSGTHLKELSLWESLSITPQNNPNYFESGQGMAETLRMADEKGAYTISDAGTFLKIRNLKNLRPFIFKEESLKNIYSVCLVSKEKIGAKRFASAFELYKYLSSDETQKKIKEFSLKNGGSYGLKMFEPIIGE